MPRSTPPQSPTPRREFLGRIAATSLAVGLSGAIPAALAAEAPRVGRSANPESWLDDLHGKHRQVFDAVTPNGGMSLIWALVFMNTSEKVSHLKDGEVNPVVVFRHESAPLALNSSVWAKYKIGEATKITDPVTKAPSLRNPYSHPNPGEMLLPGASVEDLIARGVHFGVCNVALTVASHMRAAAAGVSKEEAYKEWVAGVIPGITVVPAGVWAVNHAQEKGCTYCYAG